MASGCMALVRASVNMRLTHGTGSKHTRMEKASFYLNTMQRLTATFAVFLAPARLCRLQRALQA